jgi:hypothetical protein
VSVILFVKDGSTDKQNTERLSITGTGVATLASLLCKDRQRAANVTNSYRFMAHSTMGGRVKNMLDVQYKECGRVQILEKEMETIHTQKLGSA